MSTGAHVRKIVAQSRKNTPVISNCHAELLIDLSFDAKRGPGLLSLTHLVTCREPTHWVSERKSCRGSRIIEGATSSRAHPVEGCPHEHLNRSPHPGPRVS